MKGNRRQEVVSSQQPSRWRLLVATFAITLARRCPSLYERWASMDNARWRAPLPWTEARLPLSTSRVALVNSGGLILENQQPFALERREGDCSFRVIPAESGMDELVVSHIFYDHDKVDRDPGVMLPLPALHALVGQGLLGSAAARHFSFSGGIPDPGPLVHHTAPQVAAMMREDGVDLAVLTPA